LQDKEKGLHFEDARDYRVSKNNVCLETIVKWYWYQKQFFPLSRILSIFNYIFVFVMYLCTLTKDKNKNTFGKSCYNFGDIFLMIIGKIIRGGKLTTR